MMSFGTKRSSATGSSSVSLGRGSASLGKSRGSNKPSFGRSKTRMSMDIGGIGKRESNLTIVKREPFEEKSLKETKATMQEAAVIDAVFCAAVVDLSTECRQRSALLATIRRLQLTQVTRLQDLVTGVCKECIKIRENCRAQVNALKQKAPTDHEAIIASLKEELRISRNEAVDNRKEADQLSQQVVDLEEQISTHETTISELHEQIEDVKISNKSLQERVERRENGLERATSPMYHFSAFPLHPDGEPPPFGLQLPESHFAYQQLALPAMPRRNRRGSTPNVGENLNVGNAMMPRRSVTDRMGASSSVELLSLSPRQEATAPSHNRDRRVSLQVNTMHINQGRRSSRGSIRKMSISGGESAASSVSPRSPMSPVMITTPTVHFHSFTKFFVRFYLFVHSTKV